MGFWTGIILATIFLIAAVATLAMKFFFPYHRFAALVIYLVGWIPFLHSIYIKRQWVLAQQEQTASFLTLYSVHIAYAIILFLTVYISLALFPIKKSPFDGLSDSEVSQALHDDEVLIAYLNDRLKLLLDESERKGIFSVDFKSLSNKEKAEIEDFWSSYTEVLVELDLLKKRYEGFYYLNPVTKRSLHKRAFVNGYAVTVLQHTYALKITELVDNRNLILFLNEKREDKGIEAGTFDLLKSKIVETRELIRLNTSRAYYAVLNTDDTKTKKIIKEYSVNVGELLGTYTTLAIQRPLKALEKKSVRLWFPVQKLSAEQLSYLRVTSRDYHIDAKQINGYKDRLETGDILLERREWHATNVGIPGFWTHSALYIGTLDEMNDYFRGIEELNGKSFKEYIQENFPEAYKTLIEKDENGYDYSVIESKRPGVIFMSLEESTNADSVAVLRTKGLEKEDKFKIVTQALSYLGLPYDYNFNFVTDNAMLCSELIYKAYKDVDQLKISPEELNGRLIFTPNQFAEKYALEIGQESSQLELVLFLDGNEVEGRAVESTKEEFIKSKDRPKWYALRSYVNN